MADEIKCAHCGRKSAPLGYAPYPGELGQRIGTEICQTCWREWLQKQQMIINHYGLDLMNPDAQNFLMDNAKGHFFGTPTEQAAEIDTSQEGTIKW
jgi:Fe-S cluster biosynthesis and repair protein YggX